MVPGVKGSMTLTEEVRTERALLKKAEKTAGTEDEK